MKRAAEKINAKVRGKSSSSKNTSNSNSNNTDNNSNADVTGAFPTAQDRQQQQQQQPPSPSMMRQRPSDDKSALTAKNYRLAKELVRFVSCVWKESVLLLRVAAIWYGCCRVFFFDRHTCSGTFSLSFVCRAIFESDIAKNVKPFLD